MLFKSLRLQNMLLSFLLLIFFAEELKGDPIDLNTAVDHFIEEVFMRSTSSKNAFRDMEEAADENKRLLELTLPIASLIALGSNTSFEAFSVEHHALQKVNKELRPIFRKINSNQIQYEGELVNDRAEILYQKSVGQKLEQLLSVFHKLLDPRFSHRKNHKEAFTNLCSSTSGPESLLEFVDSIYHRNCAFPTSHKMLKYISLLKALRAFINAHGINISNTLVFQQAVQALRSHSNEYNTDTIISAIEGRTFSRKELVADFVRKLMKESRREDDDTCILEEVAKAHSYQRQSMHTVIAQLRLHVLQIQILSYTCAQLNGTTDAHTLLKKNDEKVRTMFYHTVQWGQTAQSVAYPNVSIEMARTALGAEAIDPSSFNQSAKIIQTVFEERGRIIDHFQVLVWVYGDSQTTYACRTLSDSDNQFFVHTNGGVNVNVLRFEMSLNSRLHRARKWLELKKKGIQDALLADVYNVPEGMVDALQKNFHILDDNAYRHAILLRRRTLHPGDAEIALGIASHLIDERNTTENVHQMWNSVGSYAYKWILQVFP
ncbi:hypothetical protein PENTCL1PPCAC_21162 [Pristionchus entomophagus]|uniref:Uncharacterized protein n=1 Tax=Pristionchus entomophagus TaxID=358040 RepID=A0AAV5TY05_9BILA|nr:hypothetical protein PENTCL1PPCAC_21162 [Pristionchus entomophagus]